MTLPNESSEEAGKTTSVNWLTRIWPWTRGNRTRQEQERQEQDQGLDRLTDELVDVVEKITHEIERNNHVVEKFAQEIEKNNHLLKKLIQTTAEKETKVDWTPRWSHSKWIHNVGTEAHFQRVIIYFACVGGLMCASRHWRRSHHLVRATLKPVGSEQRKFHKVMGGFTEKEILNANVVVNRIRTEGIVMGIRVPLMWLEYIRSKNKIKIKNEK